MGVKVRVDRALCQGSGLCELEASPIIQVDEDYFAFTALDEDGNPCGDAVEVPDEMVAKIRIAENKCPTQAITVID